MEQRASQHSDEHSTDITTDTATQNCVRVEAKCSHPRLPSLSLQPDTERRACARELKSVLYLPAPWYRGKAKTDMPSNPSSALTGCVMLNKHLNYLSEPVSLICRKEVTILALKHCCEGWIKCVLSTCHLEGAGTLIPTVIIQAGQLSTENSILTP